MLDRVVSGGQSGADQAGWRAAYALLIATGGWMPAGFLTEDGPRPEFADRYGAKEMPTASYADRTFANVRDSGATIWFGTTDSAAADTTLEACRKLSRSFLVVKEGITRPAGVAIWLGGFKVLNAAGNRESVNPGIGERTERFLVEVFRRLPDRG